MSNDNIKYYDWVPFFKAICNEIATLASDTNREIKLLDLAHNTFYSDHQILHYSTIDPFSFIYALAQRNTTNQRIDIFTRAINAFNLSIALPTDFHFPTPTPQTPSLFFAKGKYVDSQENLIGNECLWNLFTHVYSGVKILEEDFSASLSLKNVGSSKLSQAMFLINPKKYIPIDSRIYSLSMSETADFKKVSARIDEEGLPIYLETIEKLRKAFPGLNMYEINYLNGLIYHSDQNQLKITNKYCQVSSWANDQNDKDYFDDFVEKNAVWTGGPTGRKGVTVYPLQEFDRGDIVLVRRGTKKLGGIALVIENEYLHEGYGHDKKIKVVWLVKKEKKIKDDALGQWGGFSYASEKTIRKFNEAYPSIAAILESIRKNQKVMINHSTEKYKNLILQGPPGSGKTRLAKQIAEWLTSDEEKEYSLIEAIDKGIFHKEPEVEGNKQVKLIQFHPSYTYEDFVRGIKVNTEGEKIKYEVENRIMASFAEEASKPENQHKAYVLIIDEINRANLTSVLGELIYALEYRGKSVSSLYTLSGGANEIELPHNLYILGTMNTADRSVSNIDYAIRRRFSFIPVLSNDAAITHNKAKSLFTAVKQIFNDHTSPEFDQQAIQIGHSYFLVDDNEIAMQLKYEIKPLLIEYINDGVLLESAREKVKELNV